MNFTSKPLVHDTSIYVRKTPYDLSCYDYVELANGLIFIVESNYHPRNSIRAALIYVPDKNGDRISPNGRSYKKFKVAQGNFSNILAFGKQYLNVGEEQFISFPDTEMVKRYSPRSDKHLSYLHITPHEKKFIDDISNNVGISVDKIGVMGSKLLGLSTEFSDLDLVIYGKEELRRLQENFGNMIKSGVIRNLTKAEIAKLTDEYAKYHDMNWKQIFTVLSNQQFRCMFQERPFKFHFAYNSDEIQSFNPGNLKEEIEAEFMVIDNIDSFYMPSILKVENSRGEEYTVFSYDWLFFNPAKIGQIVNVRGRMMGNNYINVYRRSDFILPVG